MTSPYLLQSVKGLGQALKDRRVRGAYQSAYMGDPQAMQELAGQSPELARQLQIDLQKRKDTTAQQGLNKQANQSKRRNAFLKEARVVMGDLSKFGSYAEAKATGQNAKNKLIQSYPEVSKREGFTPEFTEQDFNEAKTIHGKAPKEAGGAEGTAGIKDFQYYQELKESDPESAKQFGMERGFVTKEGRELSGHLQKRLSVASDSAISSESNVGQYNSLADQISEADISGGLFGGSWGEAIKDITGSQDAKTELRKKYNAIRGLNVVKNLPPGSASDVDVKLALSGFPTDNATGKHIASFLRGLAKIEQASANLNNFKAEYISEHGTERNMLSEWKKSNEASAKEDSAAVTWAKKNPSDPRAQTILSLQGK